MTQRYRLATLEDAEQVRELVLKAYAPIRELGINFAAATADLPLVKKHIENNLCYLLEEDGHFWRPFHYECHGACSQDQLESRILGGLRLILNLDKRELAQSF